MCEEAWICFVITCAEHVDLLVMQAAKVPQDVSTLLLKQGGCCKTDVASAAQAGSSKFKQSRETFAECELKMTPRWEGGRALGEWKA